MLKVYEYGLHEKDGFFHLVQADQQIQNIVGLKKPGITMLKNFPCPHNITLNRPDPAETFKVRTDDPLVNFLLPLTKLDPNSRFISDGGGSELQELLFYARNMYSPASHCTVPIWSIDINTLRCELHRSNILTLILTNVGDRDSDIDKMKKIAKMAYYAPVKVLFVGGEDVAIPPHALIKRITTKIKLKDSLRSIQEWEKFGSKILREFMIECQRKR